MKNDPDFIIPGCSTGLILGTMPTGDYLGFEDVLLDIICDLKVSGAVEFYTTPDGSSLGTPGSKLALGFSSINNTAALKVIKNNLDADTSDIDLGHEPTPPDPDDYEYDNDTSADDAAEDKTATENKVKDLWGLKSLSAIRSEFTFIGALEYKDGKITKVLFCPSRTPFENMVKQGSHGFFDDNNRYT